MATLLASAACGRDEARSVIVEVTGAEYRWRFRYGDREAQGDLHLPAGTAVRLELRSKDFVYTFALPHLGKKGIAVPDLAFGISFETGEPGRFPLRGDQFCGFRHPSLLGEVVVEDRSSFNAWRDALPRRTQ